MVCSGERPARPYGTLRRPTEHNTGRTDDFVAGRDGEIRTRDPLNPIHTKNRATI
ncbi:hypothetical protein MYX84_06990 [Acidobacteria bacterium AH-259-O06]|nr:hypothetical protein [Acidobacteria bacterium AH-259-O06]